MQYDICVDLTLINALRVSSNLKRGHPLEGPLSRQKTPVRKFFIFFYVFKSIKQFAGLLLAITAPAISSVLVSVHSDPHQSPIRFQALRLSHEISPLAPCNTYAPENHRHHDYFQMVNNKSTVQGQPLTAHSIGGSGNNKKKGSNLSLTTQPVFYEN